MFKHKYNEKTLAEEVIKNGFSTRHFNGELRVLTKYYKELGHPPKEREELVYKLCEEKLEGYNRVEYFKRINSALNYAKKKESKLIVVNDVKVTEEELKYIDQVKLENTYKKIIFTLLVLDKLNKAVQTIRNPDKLNKEHYFGGNDRSYKELVEASRVPLNGRKKDSKNIHDIIRELGKEGIVEIRNNGYIKLSFIYDIPVSDKTAMTITTFDNIGFYYDLHIADNKVKECECCGIPIKIKSNRTKYCDECLEQTRVKQNREKSLKYYHKSKDVN